MPVVKCKGPMMTPKLPIYMDCHATTPVDPRVFEAMAPYFCQQFGNPASRTHVFGQRALEAVEMARREVALLIGATPQEIIFTSGATESNNLALLGVAEAYSAKGNHIVTCVTEHPAVLDPCRMLASRGFDVTVLPVGRDGRVDPAQLEAALTPQTILVSIMSANNEIGVLQPLREIGEIAARHGVLFHSDAAQMCGKLPIDVGALGIHLLSISGHKMYGPKGVGALYVRRREPRVLLVEQIHGGGQERGLRSGTLNVTGIVGLGKACEIARSEMSGESKRTASLRDRLLELLQGELSAITVNGSLEHRLPNNLNVSFEGVEGETLLMSLRDVAVSSGSACSSASQEASHVLKALGLAPELVHSSIRFGLGRFTTLEEVEYVAGRLIETVRRLREMSPGEWMA